MRFLDPDLIVDPYPHYAAWREEQPIWWDEETKSWVLSRHDDVRAVLKDSTTYSSAAMGSDNPLPLLSDDPPRHTQLRGLVNKAFTVRRLRAIEDSIDNIANTLVNNIADARPTDIVQSLTIPLPVEVITRMMGIPGERAEDFKRWSDALTGTLAGLSNADRLQEIGEMAAFFQQLIPQRRANPGEDLVSAVVNAEVDGSHMSDQDIVGFNILLLIAGNETTTNLLGNMLNILVERPDLWTHLRENPKLLDAAIEETLRFDGPVQFLTRELTADMTIHGQELAAGDNVTVVMGSANRDPRCYEYADQYRLDRAKNHHHTFGFGIHFCIGAPLARLEARVAMRALLSRFASVKRAQGDNERVPSHLLRGFHHLWLEFSS